MPATAGMYVVFGHQGVAGSVSLLTGVELSWSMAYKRFFPCGSLLAANIFQGPIAWEGKYKKAYVTPAMLGSFNVGTYLWVGTLYPTGNVTGGTIAGTLMFVGGQLSNMAAESLDPVEEEHSFIMYNMTISA
jgi:hypothetical protein